MKGGKEKRIIHKGRRRGGGVVQESQKSKGSKDFIYLFLKKEKWNC